MDLVLREYNTDVGYINTRVRPVKFLRHIRLVATICFAASGTCDHCMFHQMCTLLMSIQNYLYYTVKLQIMIWVWWINIMSGKWYDHYHLLLLSLTYLLGWFVHVVRRLYHGWGLTCWFVIYCKTDVLLLWTGAAVIAKLSMNPGFWCFA